MAHFARLFHIEFLTACAHIPGVMLMQMISGGAMGGGISSVIARAPGAGRRDTADQLVLRAVLVNVALGLFFSALMLLGPAPYRGMGGGGAPLAVACRHAALDDRRRWRPAR